MHKSFKNIGLSSAALALVMAPAALMAQDAATAPSMPDAATTATPPPTETTESAAPGAPAAKILTAEEQEAAIATWPAETQSYYRSLDEERQKMFWALTDADKVRLSQLPEEQRELAWGQIKAQIKASQG